MPIVLIFAFHAKKSTAHKSVHWQGDELLDGEKRNYRH